MKQVTYYLLLLILFIANACNKKNQNEYPIILNLKTIKCSDVLSYTKQGLISTPRYSSGKTLGSVDTFNYPQRIIIQNEKMASLVWCVNNPICAVHGNDYIDSLFNKTNIDYVNGKYDFNIKNNPFDRNKREDFYATGDLKSSLSFIGYIYSYRNSHYYSLDQTFFPINIDSMINNVELGDTISLVKFNLNYIK